VKLPSRTCTCGTRRVGPRPFRTPDYIPSFLEESKTRSILYERSRFGTWCQDASVGSKLHHEQEFCKRASGAPDGPDADQIFC